MAARHGVNEGFRMLAEFVCEARPASEASAAGPVDAGAKGGIQIIAEFRDGAIPLANAHSNEKLATKKRALKKPKGGSKGKRKGP